MARHVGPEDFFEQDESSYYDYDDYRPAWWHVRDRWAVMTNAYRMNTVLYVLGGVCLIALLIEIVTGDDRPSFDTANQVSAVPSTTTTTTEATGETTTTSVADTTTTTSPSSGSASPSGSPSEAPSSGSQGGTPAGGGGGNPKPTQTTSAPATSAPTTPPPTPTTTQRAPTTTSPTTTLPPVDCDDVPAQYREIAIDNGLCV